MIIIDEHRLTGEVRAEVSFARDNGQDVAREVTFALAIADLLELPDDTLFIAAVTAARQAPTQLNDPASLARTRDIALTAGNGKPPTSAGLA
jgi:hypothetical protein